MLPPRGYTLQKCIRSNSRSELYAALRDADAAPVVLKRYARDQLADGNSRAQREFAALREVEGPGIIRALDLLPQPRSPILVLDHPPGIVLELWVGAAPPPLAAFLAVALGIARALARVQQARLIHRDINPSNILVDPASLQTHLIDFGTARPLGSGLGSDDSQTWKHGFGDTLAFAAPEQTGRMDRGIDARSDLYSLGATLYFALTGRPPFEARDPLALVHSHLARLPVAPLELRPGLPAALSRIVLKLLQKEPEDRYQTAHALARDLAECQEQLARRGQIDEQLPLGAADAPGRPVFSQRLYGREREIAALREAYSRAALGGAQLVLLSGPAGAGKSALVRAIRRSVVERSGYLCPGSFDRCRRDVPYVGFIAALGSFVQQILTESDERLARWRQVFRASLGDLAALMVEWVPELGAIVGELPALPQLGAQEAQARRVLAVQRTARACAEQGHPLAIFLDDLQWADRGSYHLLQELLCSRTPGLLLLAAYRDGEVEEAQALRALLCELEERALPVLRIALVPLDPAAAAELLADALGRAPEQTRGLAEQLVRKTGGNPLSLQQFVLHLHALGRIRFEPADGWVWDAAAIASAQIPEGAVALMIAKLERLDARALELIRFTSCVRSEFDVELLAQLSAQPREVLEPPLFALAEEGLIVPSRRGFRFAHERIREAAQALLPEDERSLLHYRTGRLLLQRTPAEGRAARAFEIADHLQRGARHLGEGERREAVAIHLEAGRRALASGAPAPAAAFLAAGCKLFRPEDAARDPAQAFALFREAAQAACQAQQLELAGELLGALEQWPLTRVQQAQVAAQRVHIAAVQRPDAALDLVLAALRRFGVRWPRQPSRLRARLSVLYTDWLVRAQLEERAALRARSASSTWIAPLLLIREAAPLLIRSRSHLLCLANAYALRTALRHGVCSPIALAGVAPVLMEVLDDWRGVERYARAAARWMKRESSPSHVRARFLLQAFAAGWFTPRRELLEPLWATAEEALEVGDVDYAAHAAQLQLAYSALFGEPVSALASRIELLRPREHWPRMRGVLERHARLCALLRSEKPDAIDWSAELAAADAAAGAQASALPEAAEIDLTHGRLQWMAVLCVFGEYARAEAQAEQLLPVEVGRMRICRLDHAMFLGLCAAVLAGSSRGRLRRRRVRALRRERRWLLARAGHAPDAVHMAGLLDAEWARLRADVPRALRLYAQAAQRAALQGYRQHAALIHERRASLLLAGQRSTEARGAVLQAIALYAQWGCAAKVRQLGALADAARASLPAGPLGLSRPSDSLPE